MLEHLLRLSPQVAVIVRDSPALSAVVAKTFTVSNTLTLETLEAIFGMVRPSRPLPRALLALRLGSGSVQA